jgi:hypothetical protein
LCPAAVGISHHINPHGGVEPCPVVQFGRENVTESGDLNGLIADSDFLRRFREMAAARTRGCILLEDPELLRDFLTDEQADDMTGRGTGYDELRCMSPACSHNMTGDEIPEKHWAYRFAKKHWFFGFGAYG